MNQEILLTNMDLSMGAHGWDTMLGATASWENNQSLGGFNHTWRWWITKQMYNHRYTKCCTSDLYSLHFQSSWDDGFNWLAYTFGIGQLTEPLIRENMILLPLLLRWPTPCGWCLEVRPTSPAVGNRSLHGIMQWVFGRLSSDQQQWDYPTYVVMKRLSG